MQRPCLSQARAAIHPSARNHSGCLCYSELALCNLWIHREAPFLRHLQVGCPSRDWWERVLKITNDVRCYRRAVKMGQGWTSKKSISVGMMAAAWQFEECHSRGSSPLRSMGSQRRSRVGQRPSVCGFGSCEIRKQTILRHWRLPRHCTPALCFMSSPSAKPRQGRFSGGQLTGPNAVA